MYVILLRIVETIPVIPGSILRPANGQVGPTEACAWIQVLCWLAHALKRSLSHSQSVCEEGRITNRSQHARHLTEEAIQESVQVCMDILSCMKRVLHIQVPHSLRRTLDTKLKDIFMTEALRIGMKRVTLVRF